MEGKIWMNMLLLIAVTVLILVFLAQRGVFSKMKRKKYVQGLIYKETASRLAKKNEYMLELLFAFMLRVERADETSVIRREILAENARIVGHLKDAYREKDEERTFRLVFDLFEPIGGRRS